MTAGALGTAKGCPWHASGSLPGCLAGVILGGMELVILVFTYINRVLAEVLREHDQQQLQASLIYGNEPNFESCGSFRN